MKSHTIVKKDIIIIHNYDYFAFLVKNVVFEQKYLKTTGLFQNSQKWVQETFSENLSSHEGLGGGGVKSRMSPLYPQRDRKRRLNGAVCRNHRIKRVVPCRC